MKGNQSQSEDVPLLSEKPNFADDSLLSENVKLEYKGETKEMIEWYTSWESRRNRVLALVAVAGLIPSALGTLFLPALIFIIEDLNATDDQAAL